MPLHALVARDQDHLEFLVELDVVLAAVALRVVDLIDAARLCSILPPVQPHGCIAALIFSASAGDTSLSASAAVLSEAAITASRMRFTCLSRGWDVAAVCGLAGITGDARIVFRSIRTDVRTLRIQG